MDSVKIVENEECIPQKSSKIWKFRKIQLSEFLLSNDTRLIYRGHYLEEATLKGGALGRAKANDLYGDLFSMMCRVKKMDFVHLNKYRDLDS